MAEWLLLADLGGEASPACLTRHWKTDMSWPPTDSTRRPSPEKRTFMTCELWPVNAAAGACSTSTG